ncbi:hypothetical protein GYMLUDRAFT_235812 [Collybiopsis luxurians FD-317 M1]|nr:hypothetical protein GYMLUDRAFT_235812 [Collybiopsis luxurians FD-317 M1]
MLIIIAAFLAFTSIFNFSLAASVGWAGFFAPSPAGDEFITASGTFILPKVNDPAASKGREASFWVGITNGYGLDTSASAAAAAIVQAGVDVLVLITRASEVVAGLHLEGGDKVKITIRILGPTKAAVIVSNETKRKSITLPMLETYGEKYAVWMVENHPEACKPTGARTSFLNFGEVKFSNCKASTKEKKTVDLSEASVLNMRPLQNEPVLVEAAKTSALEFSLRVKSS